MFQFYSVRAVIALNFSLKMNMEWSISPVFDGWRMDAAQKAIYQRAAQVKSQSPPTSADQQEPQTATIDVAEQIKKLGELRDQGFLTEQEFDSKKQELLARM